MRRLLLASLCLWLLTACSVVGGRSLSQGNEAFDKESYDEALLAYQEAGDAVPDRAEPIYNAANALYRQEIYEEAEALLQEALLLADEGMAEAAFFNLGNAAFLMEGWETAVEAYKNVLRLNPANEDAKYNLELALANMPDAEGSSQEEEDSPQSEPQPESEAGEDEGSEGEQEQNQPEDENGETGESEEEQPEDESEEPAESEEDGGEADSGEAEQTEEEAADTAAQAGPDGEQEQEAPQDAPDGSADDVSDELASEDNEGVGQNAPVEGLTDEQARLLLEAISANTQTLQERLQDQFVAPQGDVPERDW